MNQIEVQNFCLNISIPFLFFFKYQIGDIICSHSSHSISKYSALFLHALELNN